MRLFDIMATSFDNFDSSVKQYLSKTFTSLGYQYTHNQIFGVIFDGIKGIMQNAMFYIEDALTEQNIFTATRRKSIYSLAKISGYDPYYGSAASGSLIGHIIRTASFDNVDKVYIDNYTRLINDTTGLNYVMMLNTNRYVIYANQPLLSHEFKIVQGIWRNFQYSCTGEPLEKISIDAAGLFDREYLKVFVNGEQWDIVSSLYDMSENSKEVILSVGYENVFDIMFGNGIYGLIPEAGSTVQIYYLSHSGKVGNIGLLDKAVFKFIDNGYTSSGDTVNLNEYITLDLNTVISGGTDSDTIEFVRNMIGCNSRSNVIASEQNFKLFFKRFSFIGYVNCWSEENSMTVYATAISNIIDNVNSPNEYFKLTNKINKEQGIILTNEQKQMVINTLKNSNKSFAGLSLKFQDPEIRRYAAFCYVKSKSVYSKQDIQESIIDALGNYFMQLKDDTKFIPKSDIINICSNIHDDIESFDIDFISEIAEEAYMNSYYYKNELEYIDGQYQFVKTKVYYEADTTPGIDAYGNITLDTKLEIPILGGGFKYYPNKDANDKTTSVKTNAVTVIWI